MQDDRQEGVRNRVSSDGGADHDTLGALINTAGKRPAPPPEAYEQVFAAAHATWRAKLRARGRRRLVLALAASLAAVSIGGGLLVGLGPGSQLPAVASAGIIQGDVRVLPPTEAGWRPLDRSTGPLVAGTRVQATATGRVALVLPGELSLRVDAATELTLHSARELELVRGTIYIDSGQRAAAEPISVTTGFGVVSDIGTQFEVTATDASLRIRVREGAVRVDGGPVDVAVLGRAGEQLSLGADGLDRDPFSPFDAEWTWVETLADTPAVEGRSLMFFLDWVARETGRPVRFDAPATETRARTVVLHGSAEDLSPMQALDVMLATTDLDYRLHDDGAIVISPRLGIEGRVR